MIVQFGRFQLNTEANTTLQLGKLVVFIHRQQKPEGAPWFQVYPTERGSVSSCRDVFIGNRRIMFERLDRFAFD